MRERITQESPSILETPTIVYLSSLLGPSFQRLSEGWPSGSIEHQRPLNTAFVNVALNFASNCSWVSLGFELVSGFSASAPDRLPRQLEIRREIAIVFMASNS